jgi:hypothetical protein
MGLSHSEGGVWKLCTAEKAALSLDLFVVVEKQWPQPQKSAVDLSMSEDCALAQ